MSRTPAAIVVTLLAILQLSAQDTKSIQTVRGEIQTDDATLEPHLAVQLQGVTGLSSVQRAYVHSDGSFEFHDVPPGSYVLRVLRAPEESVIELFVNVMGASDTLQVRLPKQDAASHGRAGTVSVRQLQHPVSKNAIHAFAKAQHYSDAGDHSKAIAELRQVLADPSAEGYAHANLGAEYLRAGQPDAAIAELEESIRLVPDSATAHTNLAYAYSVTRNLQRAEEEARRALQINRSYAQAHYLLGHILLTRGTGPDEGVENLKVARREIPKARIVLAQFYARRGQKEAARQELQEFIGEATGEDRTRAERWLSELDSLPAVK